MEQNYNLKTNISNVLQNAPISLCAKFFTKEELKSINFEKFHIATIWDLYNMNIDEFQKITPKKREKIQYLYDRLHNNAALLQKIVEYISIPVIPTDTDQEESFAQMLKRFLKEFVSVSKNKIDILTTPQQVREKAVECTYIHGYNHDITASELHKDREYIRQLTSSLNPKDSYSFVRELRNMVFSNQTHNKGYFTLSERFIAKLKEVDGWCQRAISKSSFMEKCGQGADEKTLLFGIDFTGTNLYAGNSREETRINDDFIIKCSCTDLKSEYWGAIFNILNDKIKPYSKAELRKDIQKKFPRISSGLLNIIFEMIEDSSQFEKTGENFGRSYQLSWKDLSGVQSRVERILYDSQEQMQREKIESIYHELLAKNKLPRDLKSFKISSARRSSVDGNKEITNIVEQQAGGYWIWKELATHPSTMTLKDVVERYVIEKRGVLIEDTIKHVRTFIPTANEKSIKSLLNTFCYTTREKTYVYKTAIKEFPKLHFLLGEKQILDNIVKAMQLSKDYTVKDLHLLYFEKYGVTITEQKIYRIVTKYDNLFVIIKGEGRRNPIKIKLTKDYKSIFESINLEKNKTTTNYRCEYKNTITAHALSILRGVEGHQMQLKELVRIVKTHIPNNIKFNNIYKIFDSSLFIKKKDDKNPKNIIILLNTDAWEQKYEEEIKSSERQSMIQVDKDGTQSSKPQTIKPTSTSAFVFNPDQHMKDLKAGVKNMIYYYLNKLKKDDNVTIDFDIAWDNMIDLIGIIQEPINGGWRRLFGYLYNYIFFSTTHNERYNLYTELRLSYEPLIKSLYKALYPEEDIVSGLGTNIKNLQKKNILPKETQYCHITRYISHIINTRNTKTHEQEYTPDDGVLITRYKEFLTLYLYTIRCLGL